MPFSDISALSKEIKDALPKAAQQIFLRAFNSAYERLKDEAEAFQRAWGAVKKAGYRENAMGNWVKFNSIQYNSLPYKQNDGYATFENFGLTVQGVANGALKTNDEIVKATYPPVIPIWVDHPKREPNEILQRILVGFGDNIHVDTSNEDYRIVCNGNIFNEYKNTIDRIVMNELNEASSEYAPQDVEIIDTVQVFNGTEYDRIEKNLAFSAVALMELDRPCLGLDKGVGIIVDEIKPQVEVNSMADNDMKETEMKEQKPAEEPATPEPTTSEPMTEPAKEVQEPVVEPPVVEEPSFEERFLELEKKYVAVSSEVEKMRPFYDMGMEMRKTEMNSMLSDIRKVYPEFKADEKKFDNDVVFNHVKETHAVLTNVSQAQREKTAKAKTVLNSIEPNAESTTDKSINDINREASMKAKKHIRGE